MGQLKLTPKHRKPLFMEPISYTNAANRLLYTRNRQYRRCNWRMWIAPKNNYLRWNCWDRRWNRRMWRAPNNNYLRWNCWDRQWNRHMWRVPKNNYLRWNRRDQWWNRRMWRAPKNNYLRWNYWDQRWNRRMDPSWLSDWTYIRLVDGHHVWKIGHNGACQNLHEMSLGRWNLIHTNACDSHPFVRTCKTYFSSAH
jgi:hypothetical protein